MAKAKARYVCQSCGAVSARWSGRCDACGDWNSITEEAPSPAKSGPQASRMGKGRRFDFTDLRSDAPDPDRMATGLAELDRALGGGLVPGSAILLGGDPGIGKSTLLLQAAGAMAQAGKSVFYLSGEEAAGQVRGRARRLGLADAPVQFASETNVADILATLEAGQVPDLLIIDSVQTLFAEGLESAPGTVAQVRTTAQALITQAKRTGIALVLVGHVTKEGQIAGPRVLEHMVDTVLYFEGERGLEYRIVRAVKNRFGPAGEIGVFEMRADGLAEVENPSALFLSGRETDTAGTAVFAGIEGSRPLLVQIEALAAPTAYGQPRRAVVGWDAGRLAMILAVLDSRAGLGFGAADVYLNVAGGLRIQEPAADLAVAAALLSAHTGTPLGGGTVFFGEVSLTGEIRAVTQAEARLKEAGKLGFKKAYIPAGQDLSGGGMKLHRVGSLTALAEALEKG